MLNNWYTVVLEDKLCEPPLYENMVLMEPKINLLVLSALTSTRKFCFKGRVLTLNFLPLTTHVNRLPTMLRIWIIQEKNYPLMVKMPIVCRYYAAQTYALSHKSMATKPKSLVILLVLSLNCSAWQVLNHLVDNEDLIEGSTDPNRFSLLNGFTKLSEI